MLQTGYTPLHLSSAAGHRDIVELFLSHNSINVNIQNNVSVIILILSPNDLVMY